VSGVSLQDKMGTAPFGLHWKRTLVIFGFRLSGLGQSPPWRDAIGKIDAALGLQMQKRLNLFVEIPVWARGVKSRFEFPETRTLNTETFFLTPDTRHPTPWSREFSSSCVFPRKAGSSTV
jgi:hypothetical protein